MFKQRDATTNSAWHSPEKGSLGSRGQTNFICPLGVFCWTRMSTKDTIYLYCSLFLTIQGSEEVKPVTGWRCVMDSTCLFSFANHHTDAQPGTEQSIKQLATQQRMCFAQQGSVKGEDWLCNNLKDGKGPKVHHWSPSSADSQKWAWPVALQTITISSTIIWEWEVWNTAEGFIKPSPYLSPP